MSREILKLMQKIDSSTVDLQMVLQCAPVLAGLKVSNKCKPGVLSAYT